MDVRRWLWTKRQALRRRERDYAGFFSYKDMTDGDLTKALQTELLHRGTPMLGIMRRRLRIFLDRPNLTGPALWRKLAGAIDNSRWLVVFACPEATASEWVCDEITHFLERKGDDRKKIQLVLTAGEITWDKKARNFDAATTTAVPGPLYGTFDEFPRFIDMRWTRGQRVFSMRDNTYREQVTDLARTLNELDGFQETEAEKRLSQRRLMVTTAIGLVVAVVAAFAIAQSIAAQRERDNALSRRLLSEARAEMAFDSTGDDVDAIQKLLLSLKIGHEEHDEGVLLNALADRQTTVKIIETPDVVNGVAVNDDGTRIASAGADSVVRIWSAADGTEVGSLSGHEGEVLSVAYSPDGKTIATGGRDKTVRMWDAVTGAPQGSVMQADGPVKSLAFRRDGRLLASAGSTATVQLWDVATHRPTGHDLHVERDGISTVTFDAAGRVITGCWYGTIRVWNPTDGTEVTPKLMGQGRGEPVGAVAASPVDPRIVAGGSTNAILRLWNTETGAFEVEVFRPGHADVVSAVAFSRDGRRMVSGGGDQSLRVWDVDQRRLIRDPLVGHRGTITGVAYASNGLIVSGSTDRTVRIWNPNTALAMIAGQKYVVSVAYNADGSRIATTSDDGTLRIWDGQPPHLPATDQTVQISSNGVNAVAFSPSGDQVITGGLDGTVRLWHVDTRTPQGLVLGSHTKGSSVRDVAVSVDGLIASAGDDGKVLMWDSVKRESQDLDKGPRQWSPVECVDFSRDGKLLVFGRANGVVEVWNVERRQRIARLTGHRDKVRDVAFNNDGTRLASASVDSTVRIWDIASEKQIHELRGHQGVVWKVAYSPDGNLLATAGREGTIRLWRADDGTSVGFPITGHKGPVRSVAFSPEGRELASVSDDMTLRFWPAAPSVDALCAKLTTNMSDEEWRRSISPDAEYRKACENLPIAERDYSVMPHP